jgi:hypothetical protein
MYIRNRFSKKTRILMAIGMACLLLATLPRVIHWVAPGILPLNMPLRPDQRDFVYGLLLGLSIGFNLLAVWKNTHRSKCAQ